MDVKGPTPQIAPRSWPLFSLCCFEAPYSVCIHAICCAPPRRCTPPIMHRTDMADNELRLNIADVSRRMQASRQASMDNWDQPETHTPAEAEPAVQDTTHCEDVAPVLAPIATPTPTVVRPKPTVLKPNLSPRRHFSRAEHSGTFNIFHANDDTPAVPKGKAHILPPYATDPNAKFEAPVRRSVAAVDPVPPAAIDTGTRVNNTVAASLHSSTNTMCPHYSRRENTTCPSSAATRTPRKPGFPWQWAFTDDQGKPLPEPEMPPYEAVEAPDFACMSPRNNAYIALSA